MQTGGLKCVQLRLESMEPVSTAKPNQSEAECCIFDDSALAVQCIDNPASRNKRIARILRILDLLVVTQSNGSVHPIYTMYYEY